MFTKIDFQTWDRAEHFEHFYTHVPCDYNITALIDISQLIARCKAKKIKLYAALIFMLTEAVNKIPEMRLAFNEQQELGYYDKCHPSYTISNASESSFSGIWTYAQDTFKEFYKLYLQDTVTYSASTLYAPKSNQPQNTFYVTCSPTIAFTSLNLNLYNGAQCLTPMFTFGKYSGEGQKIMIPLASRLHHAACDGYHTAKLYQILQDMCDTAQEWLND